MENIKPSPAEQAAENAFAPGFRFGKTQVPPKAKRQDQPHAQHEKHQESEQRAPGAGRLRSSPLSRKRSSGSCPAPV